MLYLPTDEVFSLGVRKFAQLQWEQVWLKAREGVAFGPVPIPGKQHPDVAETYQSLSTAQKDWILMLTYSRIISLGNLDPSTVFCMLAVGRGERELDDKLRERIAEHLHEHWWMLRRGLGLFEHAGDKSWADITTAERNCDRRLVRPLCDLLVRCENSHDPALKEVVRFICGGERLPENDLDFSST